MGKTGALGACEELVLVGPLRPGEGAYSVTVRREIEEWKGSESSMGAVYATLDRLEEKGYASSRMGDGVELFPAPERGGGS